MSFTSSTYSYSFPTNVRFGAGVSSEVAPHLLALNLKTPLVVSDPVVISLPFFDKFISELKKGGLAPVVFSDVNKNPLKSDVYKGGDAYETGDCDCIIGIGGGVAMDVARAIALRINHKKDLFDYDDLLDGWQLVTEEVPYFVTLPTNAGTGSEVGRSTVISEDESHKKRVLFSPKLIAKQIFADPLLTMELPAKITASTGMDALSHNLEAFLSKGFHPMADGIAMEAIRLVGESLEKAVFEPNLEARSNMLIASLMGAVAFQKGLGIIHSLAHPLGPVVDAHHGTAISIMFPHGLAYNYAGNEEKFDRLAYAIKAESGDKLADYIAKLNKSFGLPLTLKEIGVQESDVDKLAQLASEDFCLPSNPKPATKEDFLKIYKAAL
ncbi:iron-containing alcohol dehydrogenase [Chondrinema litorale]|uniref:iron-containing alcohol dehydrogenase n=1 Tax=Chondrinema litorale TaxID=2994555 RepID=UPI0025437E79|nr:iron-containing alcohol dehydrogenase [Chondrinema litorale]UZR92328.1 iron-containing alcohol dehydrogenase [Chondrinema litorale]